MSHIRLNKAARKAVKGEAQAKTKESKRRSNDSSTQHPDKCLKLEDLSYWLGRLAVDDDASGLRQWKQQHGLPLYNVLSQPVRHELNKFFFDVTANPSKAQRKQLWYDLQLIDPTVQMKKIIRWFQNKRQYMKKQYGHAIQDSATTEGSNRKFWPRQSRSDGETESDESAASSESDSE